MTVSEGAFLALPLALVLALWLPRLHGPIDLRWDAAVYYVLGTSLANGEGYRLVNEPGAPEAVQYPPLLPLLVAGVQRLAGTSDTIPVGKALRLLYIAFSLAYVASSQVLARQFVSAPLALLAAVLVALHHDTVFLSGLLFTEIPFGLVTVLFVLAVHRERRVAASLLGAAAFLLRTSGVALLGAWVLDALLRRRWRETVLRAVLAALPVLLWQGWVLHVVTSPEYGQPAYAYQRAPYQYYNVTYGENLSLADPFRPEAGRVTPPAVAFRVVQHLAILPLQVGSAVSVPRDWWALLLFHGNSWRPVLHTVRLLLGLAALAGLALLAWRREWLPPLLVLGSLVLVALTPWPSQFGRYIAPLAPLLTLGLVLTLAEVGAHRRLRLLRWPLRVAVLAALVVQPVAVAALFATRSTEVEYRDRAGRSEPARLFYYGPGWLSFDRALVWVARHSAPSATLATADPHVAFLRTGRRAVMPPMEADPGEARRLLEGVPVDLLIVDQGQTLDIARRYGEPAVQSDPTVWTPVYDRDVRIYRRRAAVGGP